MEEPRKHWRSGTVEDTPFRVEIWSHDGKNMIKSLQIDDLPPELYGDDELHVADAEAAFARPSAWSPSSCSSGARSSRTRPTWAAPRTPTDARRNRRAFPRVRQNLPRRHNGRPPSAGRGAASASPCRTPFLPGINAGHAPDRLRRAALRL